MERDTILNIRYELNKVNTNWDEVASEVRSLMYLSNISEDTLYQLVNLFKNYSVELADDLEDLLSILNLNNYWVYKEVKDYIELDPKNSYKALEVIEAEFDLGYKLDIIKAIRDCVYEEDLNAYHEPAWY